MKDNLNDLLIPDDGEGVELENYSTESKDGMVEVQFKHLEEALIGHIEKADYVVGCVAWMTNHNILDALAKKKGVSIIIQKEDWLRPDCGSRRGWKNQLRKKYDKLPPLYSRDHPLFEFTFMSNLSWGSDMAIEPVRCVGNLNSDKNQTSPRSHHKFVLFGKDDGFAPVPGEDPCHIASMYAVWTGSFNFTKNATMSFENAVVLRHPELVEAYLEEYAQVAALSEPLDWTSEWVAPQWRLGS